MKTMNLLHVNKHNFIKIYFTQQKNIREEVMF